MGAPSMIALCLPQSRAGKRSTLEQRAGNGQGCGSWAFRSDFGRAEVLDIPLNSDGGAFCPRTIPGRISSTFIQRRFTRRPMVSSRETRVALPASRRFIQGSFGRMSCNARQQQKSRRPKTTQHFLPVFSQERQSETLPRCFFRRAQERCLLKAGGRNERVRQQRKSGASAWTAETWSIVGGVADDVWKSATIVQESLLFAGALPERVTVTSALSPDCVASAGRSLHVSRSATIGEARGPGRDRPRGGSFQTIAILLKRDIGFPAPTMFCREGLATGRNLARQSRTALLPPAIRPSATIAKPMVCK